MSDFGPMVDFFTQDLLDLPGVPELHSRAPEHALEMCAFLKAAGYTHARLEREFLQHPDYPMDPSHPLVLAGQDWFSTLNRFLDSPESHLQFDEDYDAHLMIMSTLKYFRKRCASHPSMLARDEVRVEECARLREADSRTLFVKMLDYRRAEEKVTVEKMYAYSRDIAAATLMGKEQDLAKIVFYKVEKKDEMARRFQNGEFPSQFGRMEICSNEKFQWEKDLDKEKFDRVLLVRNVFVGEDESDTRNQLAQAFQGKADRIEVFSRNATACAHFKTADEALEGFWSVKNGVSINSGTVTVMFKRRSNNY